MIRCGFINPDDSHTMRRKLSIFISLSVLSILIVLLLHPLPVNAQQTSAPESTQDDSNTSTEKSPAPSSSLEKRYLVEVIVFNYTGPISANGEIWHRTSPIEFSSESYTAETPAETESMPELTDEEENPIQFTELKELLPYLSKLLADPKYEILTYTAWTQPLYDKKSSIRVDLVPLIEPNLADEIRPFTGPPITGSLLLFENRLLFVDLDLKNELNLDDARRTGTSSAITNQPSGTFRIQEKRRVKLNEIHYFDHPFFGALVRVSRA